MKQGTCCRSLAVLAALGTSAQGAAAVEVHRYSAAAAGIFANAYLVETPAGVVAVDATLTETDSKALRARLDALGKPLRAILLTHGHPDHYNGVTNLLAGSDVPALATAGVDRVIRESDAAKERQWKPMFKDEWPARRTFPTRIVRDGESVTYGGVTFTVHDLGPGESHADSLWVMKGSPSALFLGDVVLHQVHAYVADGHTTAWLENLERVKALARGAATLYPGHGEPGTAAMLEWQKAYLTRYREEVARLAGGRTSLDEAEKATVTARMKEHLPTDRLEFLIPLGVDAVAAELASAKQ